MLAQETLPLVISTSYVEPEISYPPSYAQRVCAGFAQLGARGTTVIFPSGNYGVGDGYFDPQNTTCYSNDGQNRLMFLPMFPASCPFVTSVGATHFYPAGTAKEETAAGFSGGGFSNLVSQANILSLLRTRSMFFQFPRPSYQDQNGVQDFLNNLGEDV